MMSVGAQLAQHLVAETHALHDAGGEVLDDDVARAQQPRATASASRMLQVERRGSLSLVVLVEVAAAVRTRLEVGERRQQARDAGASRLDADHLGAEMRELQRAERARPHPGEVGDPDAGERSTHRPLRVRSTPSHLAGPRRCAAPSSGAGRAERPGRRARAVRRARAHGTRRLAGGRTWRRSRAPADAARPADRPSSRPARTARAALRGS